MHGGKDLKIMLIGGALCALSYGCGGEGADFSAANAPGSIETIDQQQGGEPFGGEKHGTAMLSWNPPSTNADGTPLEDLSGFRIYYSPTTPPTKEASEWIAVGDTTTYRLVGLPAGTYYVAVTAVDHGGEESELSPTVSTVVL